MKTKLHKMHQIIRAEILSAKQEILNTEEQMQKNQKNIERLERESPELLNTIYFTEIDEINSENILLKRRIHQLECDIAQYTENLWKLHLEEVENGSFS